MTNTTETFSNHPAPVRLWTQLARERARLVRALSIEADWAYHDGPELRARYRAAAALGRPTSDKRAVAPANGDARITWPALGRVDAAHARAAFRRLVAATHPALRQATERIPGERHWPAVRDAYRLGDLGALLALEETVCASGEHEPWPLQARVIKRECARLQDRRRAVDQRLMAMRDQFPFIHRSRLADTGRAGQAVCWASASSQTMAQNVPTSRQRHSSV